MNDGIHGPGAPVKHARPGLVAVNLVGACGTSALTAIGLFLFVKGGVRLGILGLLAAGAAAPVAAAFWLAAVWWKRGWRHARIVQLLPFLVILGWAALLLLSPVQPDSRAPVVPVEPVGE